MKEVLLNPLFLTIVFAGLGAQLIKMLIFSLKYRKVHALDIVATGGMPSSHSALLTGLTTIILLTEGPTTPFFISLAVTMVIVVDALGVRRTAGEEGLLLHKLIRQSKLKLKEPHYSLGHTPEQVIAGILFGFVVALIIYASLY